MMYLVFAVVLINTVPNTVFGSQTIAQKTCMSAMTKALSTDCTRGTAGNPIFETDGKKFTDPTSPVLQNAIDKCIPILQPAAKSIFAQLVKKCASRKSVTYSANMAEFFSKCGQVKCQFDSLKFARNFEEHPVVKEFVIPKQTPAFQVSPSRQ